MNERYAAAAEAAAPSGVVIVAAGVDRGAAPRRAAAWLQAAVAGLNATGYKQAAPYCSRGR